MQIGFEPGETLSKYRVVFHGDQRTITLVICGLPPHNWGLYTYDALNGTQLCQVTISSQTHPILGACWAYKDTLQFAMSVKADGKYMINIYELQPTSASPLYTVSSFPIPLDIVSSFPTKVDENFSFSPESFHVSFIAKKELVVFDVQDSQVLLQIRGAQMDDIGQPQFSADGHFVAWTSVNRVCVWKNTPTGYVPWCSLKARFLFLNFSWSPTSVSILCWSLDRIQVLHLSNYPSPLSPNESEPSHSNGRHLVAYSADKAHIAISRQNWNVVTILDSLLGTPQQTINSDMQVKDTKIIGSTIFVTDGHKLVSWELEVVGVVHYGHISGRVINESLNINLPWQLKLSHDCSQIAYTRYTKLSVYEIEAEEPPQHVITDRWVEDMRFSPDGHQLLFVSRETNSGSLSLGRFRKEDRSLSLEQEELEDGWSWVNLFSPHGYHIKGGSEWITSSRGSKILWLPPVWRTEQWQEVRWNGDFLAFFSGYHPKPIIIEFKQQSIPSHPIGT